MQTERCPGGYLIGPGTKLCGRAGNNCDGFCCYAWKAMPKPLPDGHYCGSCLRPLTTDGPPCSCWKRRKKPPLASAIEASGQDGETRLDAKHESASPKDDAHG